MTKKHSCYEIYKNLAIWSLNGQLAYNPCSFYRGHTHISDHFDLGSVWNSPEHLALKQAADLDQPIPGCQRCYDQEANGLISRRLSAAKLYEEYYQDTSTDLAGPQSIDYSVGNLCNLKCVICGPENSTAWIPDYQQLHPEQDIRQLHYQKFNQIEIDNTEFLKNITSVHFHGGGEPLLSANHIRLLTRIKQVKGLADVRVFYNTNGTQRVDQAVLDLWAECRLIELYFSIDDVGARFEYQRTGAVWNNTVDTIQWYRDHMPHNHMFNVNCVWSYLNLYSLPDLVEWFRDCLSTNRYGDPTNLIFQRAIGTYNIEHLSQAAIDQLTTRFSNYPELSALLPGIQVNEQAHTKFWNNINQLDLIRATSFKRLCPEWSLLL